MKILFIFFLYKHIQIIKQKYIGIKPIESKCILLDNKNCDIKDIIYKFIHRSILFNIVEFKRSQNPINLRRNYGFHAIVDPDIENCNILQVQDQNQIKLMDFTYIENRFQIDDIFNIYDSDKKTRTSMRFRIINKKSYSFNFVAHHVIESKMIPTEDDHGRDFLMNNFERLYSYRLNPRINYPYNKEIYYYYPDSNGWFIPHGIRSYINLNDNIKKLINDQDGIFNKYHLEFNGNIDDRFVNIKYVNHIANIQENKDFQDQKVLCNLDCKNGGICIFENINEVLNPKCNCVESYFGNDCSHIYYCNKCEINKCTGHDICSKCLKGWSGPRCEINDCETLQMCGKHGKCAENINKRKCECFISANGTYCTKLAPIIIDYTTELANITIDDTTKVTTITIDNTTKLETIVSDNITKFASKDVPGNNRKIIVAIIFGIIIAIIFIISIIIYMKFFRKAY